MKIYNFMKKSVILHGMPEEHEYKGNESKMHWIPWVKKELEKLGIEVFTPELPKPYAPCYRNWREAFCQYPVDENTALVGHSCGGGFLIRFLSENRIRTGPVFLVAPWLDPNDHLEDKFFEFSLDPELLQRTKGITIFVSLDDGQEVLESVEYLIRNLPGVVFKQFSDRGHFTEEKEGDKEFPELLEAITDSGILEE